MVLPAVFLIHTCTIVSRLGKNIKQIAIGTTTGTFTVGQTITGGTSHATGKVYAVAATYLQYEVLTGIFTSGEVITSLTGSASSTGAPADALTQGVPITAPATQTGVACRFVAPSATKVNRDSGEHFQRLAKVLLPAGTAVYEGDEITGNQAGFTKTYRALPPKQVYEATAATVSHISVEIEAVD